VQCRRRLQSFIEHMTSKSPSFLSLSLSLSLSLTHTHTHIHTPSLSLSHTHTLPLSLSLTHTLPLSLSLSHTHTHTNTNTNTNYHPPCMQVHPAWNPTPHSTTRSSHHQHPRLCSLCHSSCCWSGHHPGCCYRVARAVPELLRVFIWGLPCLRAGGCFCMCVCVCLCVCLCVCICVCVSMCVSVCASLCECVCACVSMCCTSRMWHLIPANYREQSHTSSDNSSIG